jgi:hypothetical protein
MKVTNLVFLFKHLKVVFWMLGAGYWILDFKAVGSLLAQTIHYPKLSTSAIFIFNIQHPKPSVFANFQNPPSSIPSINLYLLSTSVSPPLPTFAPCKF